MPYSSLHFSINADSALESTLMSNLLNSWSAYHCQASTGIYIITETARANELNVYYYIKHLLEQLVTLIDKQGNMEQPKLEPLMPWSKTLPADCYSKHRK